MISTTIKKSIFQSIPKILVIGVDNFSVFVDYADRINVSEKLKDNDVVVTLRYFADRKDDHASPVNNLLDTVISGQDIEDTRGERAQTTLSVNVYAKGNTSHPTAEIIDAYLEDLLTWYLRDLPGIDAIVVSDRSEVQDLAYLEDGSTARRQFDVILSYTVIYSESVSAIETITDPDVQEG